jgi:hypothetical protein
VTQTVEQLLAKIDRRLTRIEAKLTPAAAPVEKATPAPKRSLATKPKTELKGTATVKYVDSLVARKKAKGATRKELAEYRAALMERHGLSD